MFGEADGCKISDRSCSEDGCEIKAYYILFSTTVSVLFSDMLSVSPFEEVRVVYTSGAASLLFDYLVFAQYDPELEPSKDLRFDGQPHVLLAYLKYRWAFSDEQTRHETFERLEVFAQVGDF